VSLMYASMCCCVLHIAYPALQSVALNDVILPSLVHRESVCSRSNYSGNNQMLAYNNKHNLSTFQMAIKEHLFPAFKFCTHSKDLLYSADPNSPCQIILQHTEIHPEQYQDCWNTFQSIVKTDLTKKQNNVVGQLKRKFKGVLCVVPFDNTVTNIYCCVLWCLSIIVLSKAAPEIATNLSTIQDLRESADDRYIVFLHIMAEPFVGSRVWRSCLKNATVQLDDVLTSSNEAFLLLCCENYASKWLSTEHAASNNAKEQEV